MCRQYTGVVEVNLSPDLEGKVSRAAGRRGISAELLIREAIERAVDYDDWFIREVETGLAQIEAGQTLTHDAVGTRLAKKLAELDAGR
jgi:predicted transcriptional regulator